jgi:arylsulfatase A-like enzyme
MDLTATILAVAGATPPTSYAPEGIDLLPLLHGRREVERTLFWRIQAPGRLQRAVRRGRWKYVRDGTHEFLFDLVTDVGERRDLTVTRNSMLPEFRRLLAGWEADVDSSRAAVARQGGTEPQ